MNRNSLLGLLLLIAGVISAVYLTNAVFGDWKAFIALVLYSGAVASWNELCELIQSNKDNDKH
jgi:hypothetical protein